MQRRWVWVVVENATQQFEFSSREAGKSAWLEQSLVPTHTNTYAHARKLDILDFNVQVVSIQITETYFSSFKKYMSYKNLYLSSDFSLLYLKSKPRFIFFLKKHYALKTLINHLRKKYSQ